MLLRVSSKLAGNIPAKPGTGRAVRVLPGGIEPQHFVRTIIGSSGPKFGDIFYDISQGTVRIFCGLRFAEASAGGTTFCDFLAVKKDVISISPELSGDVIKALTDKRSAVFRPNVEFLKHNFDHLSSLSNVFSVNDGLNKNLFGFVFDPTGSITTVKPFDNNDAIATREFPLIVHYSHRKNMYPYSVHDFCKEPDASRLQHPQYLARVIAAFGMMNEEHK
jgi:hypothetical protein